MFEGFNVMIGMCISFIKSGNLFFFGYLVKIQKLFGQGNYFVCIIGYMFLCVCFFDIDFEFVDDDMLFFCFLLISVIIQIFFK